MVILWLDQSELFLKLAAEYCKESGVRSYTMTSLNDGLLLEDIRPSVIVVDYLIAQEQGEELLEQVIPLGAKVIGMAEQDDFPIRVERLVRKPISLPAFVDEIVRGER